MSLTTTSGCHRPATSSASGAETAVCTSAPQETRSALTTAFESGSSSTTSTRSPPSGAPGAASGSAVVTCLPGCTRTASSATDASSGSSTVKTAPCSVPALSARTLPPWRSTSPRTIARPSPRPPCRRVPELSACRNRSKTYGRKSGLMPSPVSRTVSRARSSTRSSAMRTRPPRGVNFTAFETRFQTTCCKRSGSPCTGTASGGNAVSSATPLASAAGRTTSTAVRTTGARSIGRSTTRKSRAARRDTSSNSGAALITRPSRQAILNRTAPTGVSTVTTSRRRHSRSTS